MSNKPGYETKPENCGVDAARVIAFRELRDQILGLLETDPQSIRKQLSELFWQDATFRLFNLARRFSTPGQEKSAVAGLLANYLDTAYVTREVVEVSRLLERPGPDPAKGVISLPAVVELLRKGTLVITRDVYVCHDGLPYDYEAAAAADFRKHLAAGGGFRWSSTEPTQSEFAHATFDRLSGKRPEDRQPSDTLKPGLLRWLERHLVCDEAAKILRLRNKVFAHAANSHSRGGGWEREGISLNDVDAVHKRILEVAEVLSTSVSGDTLTPAAVPQFDILDGLSRPFIAEADRAELYEAWASYTHEREQWGMKSLDAAPCKKPSKRPPSRA